VILNKQVNQQEKHKIPLILAVSAAYTVVFKRCELVCVTRESINLAFMVVIIFCNVLCIITVDVSHFLFYSTLNRPVTDVVLCN
jgi:hypothetical protein